MDEEKTKDEIFADALARIIKNQLDIKKHIRLISDTSEYGDGYYDWKIIRELENIV